MFKSLTQIRGPKLNNAERVSFDISGNKVSFIVPAYNYHMIEEDEKENTQRNFDLEDPLTYKVSTAVREDDRPFDPSKEPDGFPIYKTLWHFSAPIISLKKPEPRSRHDGSMDLAVFVSKFFNFQSLYIAEEFQRAIFFKINNSFGPTSYLAGPGNGGRRFIGPKYWKVNKLNNRLWVSYFIERMGKPNNGKYYWTTTLTNEHSLSFSFNITGAPSSMLFEHIHEFASQIISSCQVEFSEIVKSQMKEVKEEAKQSKISENVEPFAWEEYDLYPEKFELNLYDD